MPPAADLLVRRLLDHGVSQAFGYPGGQLTPLYDSLSRHRALRHRLARDEQAAAFMAVGYSLATGEPGVCLAVCGPGVFNCATPLHTAFTESIPLLLVSGQVPSGGQGARSGYYHENDQLTACAPLTKWRARVDEPSALVPLLDEAFIALSTGRPGPALLEVPVDVLRAETTVDPWPAVPTPPPPPAPDPAEVENLARLVASWERPLLLAGGGVVSAGAEPQLLHLAERLGAPVFHTGMGKCAFPGSHPLAGGLTWFKATSDLSNMASFFSPLFARADGLLAIGCRFSQLATGTWSIPLPPSLAQVDIDPVEIGRHYPVAAGVCADARAALEALVASLPGPPRRPWATPTRPEKSWRLPGLDVLEPLRRALPPDTILSADITRLAYILMADYPLDSPRTFLHPAGSVAMGFGIPAALGAKAAQPDRPVLAVVGDGGFLMSGMELATAVQEDLPVVVLLVNDNALSLIKSTQQRRYAERYFAVDLRNPDFSLFARAFGVPFWRADTDSDLEKALRAAFATGAPALVEVRPDAG
jgi:acetolactate synthase I/II/III large subunit